MTATSRRDAIRSAGVAAATPFVLAGLPAELLGQTATPSPAQGAPYNKDIFKYTNDATHPLVSAAQNGTLTQSHLQVAAATANLLKVHINSLNVYKQFASSVQSLAYESIASSTSPDLASLSEEQFLHVKSRLLKGGLSGIYTSLSDHYTTAGTILSESLSKPSAWSLGHGPHPHLEYGTLNSRPTLRRVCSVTAQQKQAFCSATSWSVWSLAVTATIATVVCIANAPEGDFICVGIGSSIALHSSALKAIQMLIGC